MSKIKTALISVSDKTNLIDFAKQLHQMGIKIISTAGSKKALEDAGIPLQSVSKYTGSKEMLDGRVKTLHPKVHAGILAIRDNKQHIKQLKQANIELIDMVVVNLYPFEEVKSKKDVDLKEIIENIDIGGPTLLRAAAKNHRYVAAVSNVEQYVPIIKELKENNNRLSKETLIQLAMDVFSRTQSYDKAIYEYILSIIDPLNKEKISDDLSFSKKINMQFSKIQDLRYGENPHQKAAFYRDIKITEPSLAEARQLHGKELSFNNIMDLNSALEIISDFNEPAACIIKHTNPCGVAKDKDLSQAYKEALECDPLSAFGSVVAVNKVVDEKTAKLIYDNFVECLLACGYTEKALEILKQKKNIRILDLPSLKLKGRDIDIRKIKGAALIQEKDDKFVDKKDLKVVTRKKPTSKQLDSLLFAQKVCKYVKSNAVVIAKDFRTVGIGAGQASRVDSVIIAKRKAGKRAKGAVLASDAFFPKEDAIEQVYRAGIKSIIQPGGSINDDKIIKTADRLNISMVFTGIRHFRH